MEEPIHIQDVFLLSEALFAEGNWQASIPFYRCVCENEIKQYSERLAIREMRWNGWNYEQALEYIAGYEDLSWFDGDDSVFCDFLAKNYRVFTVPGSSFKGSGYYRISFSNHLNNLQSLTIT
ncbi:hypothetical protein [Paenibacillus monticola]|uniref:Uncharacterized protein n=1 Tax=Paenibacillus monticola TaxID=2666075 RepID=A0A7X2H239_9BACL|nr:hypothetical protein [Paenibacillus monticola]MRN52144.1 hypothetical protein [Paenibacillus monticola]